ncbi:MAG: oxidoreductase-like [Rhodobacteraceae bacterium]|uniref:Gfo/Idh/MocA family protein n=1 Tax=Cypionkella sp. TaxID=2811411 RepID=UPI001320DCBF|nr:Gfo/Idh/MocA family oxidoreductase [Cypionkella sp.]KAF0172089.1 MAG: oxidoreductase-like [Paracoccaceae bacterium]MDO8326217.1 Gfo/Idh/MocA family oxidoreductase [Cypionkella sp.]
MKPVRWGILGAANFAREHMAPAIHAAKGAELAALATSSAEKAAGFQAFCPGLTVHSSYEALLADPSIDAVYIPLPNHMHVEWTLKALAAGKHVLTEKPIALHADEIDQIIAARDASGLLAAEAYMIVHHPQWQRAKQWLEAGEIGTLRHVDAAFSFHLTDMENIRNRPDAGGGSLRDIGVYTFGSARFVTSSEPVDISARLIMENGIDSFAQVAGIMDGPHGRFTYGSMTSMRLYNRQVVTFQGDKGMIRVEGGPFNANVNDLAEVELHQNGNRVITDRFPTANHYVLQVEAFGRSIRDGVAYPCPLEFVRGTQAMMDTVYKVGVEITL